MAEVDACGLPDTLVHGDFHPGNVRGEGLDLTLLDWGDAAIGHPLLDQTAFLDRLPPGLAETARGHWLDLWRQACPGADPARAEALLAPVAAARMAAVYRRFLDRTEPSEHPYHRADPADWLRRTAALLQRG
jgi:aminoglycoside phosphotransferase (APT) family kinase protein